MLNINAVPFTPKTSLIVSTSVNKYNKPIKYDENTMPIYRNPYSNQLVVFVYGVVNLPEGYDKCFK